MSSFRNGFIGNDRNVSETDDELLMDTPSTAPAGSKYYFQDNSEDDALLDDDTFRGVFSSTFFSFS